MPDDNRILDVATEETYANLIADIVGHPAGEPTLVDLERLNPSREADEVRQQLQTLRTVGVVHETERGEQRVFELTETARDIFDEQGLYPEDAWKRQYERVAEVESDDEGE